MQETTRLLTISNYTKFRTRSLFSTQSPRCVENKDLPQNHFETAFNNFSAWKSLKTVSSCFQVILRGVFVFYTPGGLCRKRRPWTKFCIIKDIVVSYTSKVQIPVSRYFKVILRGVFVFGSWVLGLRFLPTPARLTVSDRIQIPSKTTHKDTGTNVNTYYYFIS